MASFTERFAMNHTIIFPHFGSLYVRKKSADHGSYFSKETWISLLLVAVASWPVLRWYAMRLQDGGDEPWGILPLLVACWFLWRNHEREKFVTDSKWRLAGAALIFLVALGTWHLPPLMRAAFSLIGMVLLIGPQRNSAVCLLLLLSLPVISSLQFYLGWPLRVVVTECSVILLNLMGFSAHADATTIVVNGQHVAVDPACSGIRFLWHGCFFAATFAAWRRSSWASTFLVFVIAIPMVMVANIIRACVLTFQETGHLLKGDAVHEVVGLIFFLLSALLILRLPIRECRSVVTPPRHVWLRPARMMLLAAAAIISPALAATKLWQASSSMITSEVLTTYEFMDVDYDLTKIDPTAQEMNFSQHFPGSIGVYQSAGLHLIVRDVAYATRQLHPSSDCLRAAGYSIGAAKVFVDRKGGHWWHYRIQKEGHRFDVHERIVSSLDQSSWTDVSAWYWSALRHPLNGPWRAETVITVNGGLL
jgi:exosortase